MTRKQGAPGRKRKTDSIAATQDEAVVSNAAPAQEEVAAGLEIAAGLEAGSEEVVVAPVTPATPLSKPEDSGLTIRISKELQAKLKYQAEDEGITLHEYISELLAEGAVLRAWEIVERKAQMRGVHNGPSHPQQQNQRHNGNGNGHGGRRNDRFNGANNNNNNSNRRMSNNRYQSIMDDKASFLEYVRSQERQGR
jgi:hypothetical protein